MRLNITLQWQRVDFILYKLYVHFNGLQIPGFSQGFSLNIYREVLVRVIPFTGYRQNHKVKFREPNQSIPSFKGNATRFVANVHLTTSSFWFNAPAKRYLQCSFSAQPRLHRSIISAKAIQSTDIIVLRPKVVAFVLLLGSEWLSEIHHTPPLYMSIANSGVSPPRTQAERQVLR